MEDINKYNRIKDVKAEQNVLKTEYEYLMNREKRIVKDKEVLLDRLIKLSAILAKAK